VVIAVHCVWSVPASVAALPAPPASSPPPPWPAPGGTGASGTTPAPPTLRVYGLGVRVYG
jgi:hypothetical protein